MTFLLTINPNFDVQGSEQEPAEGHDPHRVGADDTPALLVSAGRAVLSNFLKPFETY